MSEIVEAELAEYLMYGNNPEDFPICPKCGEFVWMDDKALETGNYICECGNIFPIVEAQHEQRQTNQAYKVGVR